jgi:hypothetical protein
MFNDDTNVAAVLSCFRAYKDGQTSFQSDYPDEPSAAGATATKAEQDNSGKQSASPTRNDVTDNDTLKAQSGNILTDVRPAMCGGPCGRKFSSFDYMRKCRSCYRPFCGDCFALPAGPCWDGNLYDTDACSPSHEFFYCAPATTRLKFGDILVDGKVMDIKEWMAGIMEVFGLK